MTTRTWTRLARVAAAAGLSMALVASAQAAPDSFAYVGQLTDAMGPVDDTVDVTVKLWDAATDGNELWTQSWTGGSAVEVVGGLFYLQVGMGATPPLGPILLDRDDVWLGVAVNGQALAPRQKLTTIGYAQVAAHARSLGGVPAADYLTETTLGTTPSRAGTAGMAPMNPAPGQLWYDGAEQILYTWDDVDMEWEAVSTGDLEPSNLPPNGMEAVSNGVLSNEFTNVSHLWTTGANIPDAGIAGPGAPALAEINVAEASASYIYGIQINTNFDLTSGNAITMTLYPPNGTNVDPIVLLDQTLTFGPYPNIWTISNAPALEALLYTNPAGTWTVAIVDKDDNLDNGGANVAGTLNSFELRYNIVRSDNLNATGLFEVDNIIATNIVGGTVNAPTNATLAGDLRVTGELTRRLQYKTWYNNSVSGFGNISNRTITITKRYDDTLLWVTWCDDFREDTTSAIEMRFYINNGVGSGNQVCRRADGNNLRFMATNGSGNWYNDRMSTRTGICDNANNIGDGTSIPAGTYTFQMWGSTSSTVGYSSSSGNLTVEEIFID